MALTAPVQIVNDVNGLFDGYDDLDDCNICVFELANDVLLNVLSDIGWSLQYVISV